MNTIACSGPWQTSPEGYLRCAGTLHELPQQAALTAEDYKELLDSSLYLLVVVFGFLAIKKAIL